MPGDNHVRIITSRPAFSKEQKAAFGLLFVFGALGLVFGVFYLWKHIAAPFAISYTGPRFMTSSEKESEELRLAKEKDTDGDTISDYDELQVFKTSPYLMDSDSDGIDDQTEIASGDNPSCPRGGACENESDVIAGGSLSGSFLDETADAYGYTADGSVSLPDNYTIEDVVAALTPQEIRQMLVDGGADEAQLGQFSDEELRVLLLNALNEMQASGQISTDGSTAAGTTDAATGQSELPANQ